jgi:hypothetical protein
LSARLDIYETSFDRSIAYFTIRVFEQLKQRIRGGSESGTSFPESGTSLEEVVMHRVALTLDVRVTLSYLNQLVTPSRFQRCS